MKLVIIILAIILSSYGLLAQNRDALGMNTEMAIDKNMLLENNRNLQSTAEVPEVVLGFSSPVNFNCGLAFDGELLWVTGYAEYNLYGLDPINGAIVETIPIDILRPYGLTYNNGIFYIVDNDNKEIIEIDRTTYELVNINYLEQDAGTYPTGVEVINGEIWYNDPHGPYYYSSETDQLRKFSANASAYENYDAAGDFPTALAFDGQDLWSVDNSSQLIYRIDKTTFKSTRVISAPGGAYPNGLTFDGTFLWTSNNDSDSIYKIKIATEIEEDDVNTLINIDYQEEIEDVLVYPSISNYTFNINLGNLQTQGLLIRLYNIDGRIVDEINNVQEKHIIWINKDALPEGLYLFKIIFPEGEVVRKVIIRN